MLFTVNLCELRQNIVQSEGAVKEQECIESVNIKATLCNLQLLLSLAAPLDKSGSALPEGTLHFP